MTQTRHQHGNAALDAMFARAKSEKRAAFLPYFCIGYPNFDESLRAIEAAAALGVDGFEIGMPFSDPIADGPTIQAATQIALENGTTVRACLAAVRTLREKGIQQPMLMMGYANPSGRLWRRSLRARCASGRRGRLDRARPAAGRSGAIRR